VQPITYSATYNALAIPFAFPSQYSIARVAYNFCTKYSIFSVIKHFLKRAISDEEFGLFLPNIDHFAVLFEMHGAITAM